MIERLVLSKKINTDSIEFIIFAIGGMAEWSNAAVSKTVVRRKMDRGFESPFLRWNKVAKTIKSSKTQRIRAFLFFIPAEFLNKTT
jgi:hypothetical protein